MNLRHFALLLLGMAFLVFVLALIVQSMVGLLIASIVAISCWIVIDA